MRWTVLVLAWVLLALPAGAQTWRKGLGANDDVVPSQALSPNVSGGFAYYRLPNALTDSNTLDVSACRSLRIHHIKLTNADLSKFDLLTCAESTKVNCSRICPDYGSGIVCPAGGWFNGDDGTDVDFDGISQGRSMVWWGPDRFIYVHPTVASGAAEPLKVEVLCAGG